jgi:hypothetical protein
MRQIEVPRLFDPYGGFSHRVGARIARELGVSKSVVCRDVKKIFGIEDPRVAGNGNKWKKYVAQAIADTQVGIAEGVAPWRATKGAAKRG